MQSADDARPVSRHDQERHRGPFVLFLFAQVVEAEDVVGSAKIFSKSAKPLPHRWTSTQPNPTHWSPPFLGKNKDKEREGRGRSGGIKLTKQDAFHSASP